MKELTYKQVHQAFDSFIKEYIHEAETIGYSARTAISDMKIPSVYFDSLCDDGLPTLSVNTIPSDSSNTSFNFDVTVRFGDVLYAARTPFTMRSDLASWRQVAELVDKLVYAKFVIGDWLENTDS